MIVKNSQPNIQQPIINNQIIRSKDQLIHRKYRLLLSKHHYSTIDNSKTMMIISQYIYNKEEVAKNNRGKLLPSTPSKRNLK